MQPSIAVQGMVEQEVSPRTRQAALVMLLLSVIGLVDALYVAQAAATGRRPD